MSNAIRWTPQQLDDFQQRMAKQRQEPAAPTTTVPKYRNKKVESGGVRFDSRKESKRWAKLEALAQAGVITNLQRQVVFVLAPAVKFAGEARTKPALRYVADASYTEAGQVVVEDVKSEITRAHPVYRIKRHLMKTVLGLEIREI